VAMSFWTNTSEVFSSNAAANVHKVASIVVSNGFDTDVVLPSTPTVVGAGLDALRALGIQHITLNFPSLV
jgi:hypothetical protein